MNAHTRLPFLRTWLAGGFRTGLHAPRSRAALTVCVRIEQAALPLLNASASPWARQTLARAECMQMVALLAWNNPARNLRLIVARAALLLDALRRLGRPREARPLERELRLALRCSCGIPLQERPAIWRDLARPHLAHAPPQPTAEVLAA